MDSKKLAEARRKVIEKPVPLHPRRRGPFLERTAMLFLTPDVAEAAGFEPQDIPFVAEVIDEDSGTMWDYAVYAACSSFAHVHSLFDEDVDTSASNCYCHCTTVAGETIPDCNKKCGSEKTATFLDASIPSNASKQVQYREIVGQIRRINPS